MGHNPTLLGRYELLERVGLGGMAEVYKARLPSINDLYKVVALKRILPYHCEDQNFVRMFLDEARIALALNHPNIGQIYELCQDGEAYFLAMEYIDGPNLSTVIKKLRKTRHRFPLPLSVFILTRICMALHEAHNQHDDQGNPLGIIHRDVSPHNIMVSRSGGVKLIDFGIAKARDRLVQTEAGTVRGKLLYMSPEHAASRPLDPRTDVFSAGMALLTLLNGQHIWRGLDEVEVLVSLRRWQPPEIASLRPDLDADVRDALQNIFNKAMAFSPDDRYSDAEEMRADLSRLLSRIAPSLGGVELGSFVMEVGEGDLSRAERSTSVKGRESIHTQKDSSDPEANTHLTPSRPSEVFSQSTALHPPPDLADTALIERELADQILDDTAIERSQDSRDTPVPDIHTPSKSRRLVAATEVVPVLEGEGHTNLGFDPDKTPVDGLQTLEAEDDPVLRQMPTEDTGAFVPPKPTLVAPRPAPPVIAEPPPRPSRARMAPLLIIGATVAVLFFIFIAILAARLFIEPDEPIVVEKTAEDIGLAVVMSTPEGAAIEIDGEPTGMITPTRLEVSPGPHELVLRVDGHLEYRQTFTATGGEEKSFSVDLIPEIKEVPEKSGDVPPRDKDTPAEDQEQSPTLVIIADQEATVFIDGDQLPEPVIPGTPLEITPLVQGREYVIRLQRRGYETFEKEVVLEEARKEIRAEMKRKNYGYLTVTSNLWAEVYVDGRRVASSTPLRFFRLKNGAHRVTILNPERKLKRTFSVDIRPGEHRKIPVRF